MCVRECVVVCVCACVCARACAWANMYVSNAHDKHDVSMQIIYVPTHLLAAEDVVDQSHRRYVLVHLRQTITVRLRLDDEYISQNATGEKTKEHRASACVYSYASLCILCHVLHLSTHPA